MILARVDVLSAFGAGEWCPDAKAHALREGNARLMPEMAENTGNSIWLA
ncbi:hypothetical protein [Rhizobium giardinii]|jgi:hypothetical protein|nr:hypothetical protein [Rhizobium giardinii]